MKIQELVYKRCRGCRERVVVVHLEGVMRSTVAAESIHEPCGLKVAA